MTKVGPETYSVDGAQVSTQVGAQVKDAITVKLDVGKISSLLDYCAEARTGAELQQFCGIKSREYFRKNILLPLLDSGRLKRTIPDKPRSSKQKYVKA